MKNISRFTKETGSNMKDTMSKTRRKAQERCTFRRDSGEGTSKTISQTEKEFLLAIPTILQQKASGRMANY